jgi:hypothetical protein
VIDVNKELKTSLDNNEVRIRNKNDYLKFLIAHATGGVNKRICNDCLIPRSIFKTSTKRQKRSDHKSALGNRESNNSLLKVDDLVEGKKLKIYSDA